MNRKHLRLCLVICGCFLVAACGAEDPGTSRTGAALVDPSDPNAISEVLIIPGAVRIDGSPPAATGGPDAPVVSGGGEIETLNGDQAVLELSYSSPTGYEKCYVQVIGADGYFEIDVPSEITEGTLQIPVNIPENVDSGAFDLYTCIAGANGAVSNAVATTVGVTYSGDVGGAPGGNPTPGGGYICASQNSGVGTTLTCPNGSLLDFCISEDTGSCYYAVGGRQISCGNCQDAAAIQVCAQQAVQLCI